MICFVNVESVDRIIYSIFQRFDLEWKTLHPQPIYTRSLTPVRSFLFEIKCVEFWHPAR